MKIIPGLSDDINNAIIGGALIAVASSLNLFLKGVMTGISGIYYNCIFGREIPKMSFILGLLIISAFKTYIDTPLSVSIADLSFVGFLIGGFLVGLGTKLANGCTSGHGVCGLPRLSPRSFVAVCTFLTVGIVTASFRHYVPFLLGGNEIPSPFPSVNMEYFQLVLFIILGIITIVGFCYFLFTRQKDILIDSSINFLVGVIFGASLIISGMTNRAKVLGFLTIYKDWDPSLLFVLMTAVGLNLIFFWLIKLNCSTPVFDHRPLEFPRMTAIDKKLIIGSALFGLGWGLTGLCPGPALVNTFIYIPNVMIYLFLMSFGQWVAVKIDQRISLKTK